MSALEDVLTPMCLRMMDENYALGEELKQLKNKLRATEQALAFETQTREEYGGRVDIAEGINMELAWKLETYEEVVNALLTNCTAITRADTREIVRSVSNDPQMWSGIDEIIADMETQTDMFSEEEMDRLFELEGMEWN